MGVLRHEKQEYLTVAALIAETLAPQNNDAVYVESLKRTFDWIQGSATTADGVYAIDQTTATATGRWLASSVANVYTGTNATEAMANGQMSFTDITVTGAKVSGANTIAITNASALPANVFVTSKEVIAANTVRVFLENQSGGAIVAGSLNVTVLEF